jgi:hypothetical protein
MLPALLNIVAVAWRDDNSSYTASASLAASRYISSAISMLALNGGIDCL